MIKEINTEYYSNSELAEERGFYREYYKCQSCKADIGYGTFDSRYQLAQKTVMKNDSIPKYCPFCGGKL